MCDSSRHPIEFGTLVIGGGIIGGGGALDTSGLSVSRRQKPDSNSYHQDIAFVNVRISSFRAASLGRTVRMLLLTSMSSRGVNNEACEKQILFHVLKALVAHGSKDRPVVVDSFTSFSLRASLPASLAVPTFPTARGLLRTGNVSPLTWSKLQVLVCTFGPNVSSMTEALAMDRCLTGPTWICSGTRRCAVVCLGQSRERIVF